MAKIASLTSTSLVLGGALALGGAPFGAASEVDPLQGGSGFFAAAFPVVPRGLDFTAGTGLALSTALAGKSRSKSVGGGVLTGGRLGISATSLDFQGGASAVSAGSWVGAMDGFHGGLAAFATGAAGSGAEGRGAGEAGLVTECTGLTLPGGVERGVLAAPAPNRSGPSIGLVAGLFFFLSPQRPTLE